jgi:hypothetical protein
MILGFTADTKLPPFVGNTIRGAIGSALDRMGSHSYENAFKIDSTGSVTNPYTISVPYPSKTNYAKGETLDFCLILFGDACEYGADFATAAKEMCRGKLKNCVLQSCEKEYDRVWSDAGAENIPTCNEILLGFITPTEILSSKHPIPELTFEAFIDSLFGRIGGIIDNYTDTEFIVPYALLAKKPLVKAEYNLEPLRFQTSGQPISAFVGTIKYTGDITRYLPYIDLGSQIHIGKKTTRACGEYVFEI